MSEATALAEAPKRPRGNPNWVKGGSSPNPTGKRKLWTEYRNLLGNLEQVARKRLGTLIRSENDSIALQAITLFYAYTLGKPMEGETLAHLDTMLQKRLEAMKALQSSEPIETTPVETKQLEAPVEVAVLPPEPAPPEAAQPRPGDAASGITSTTLSRCMYRMAKGQCEECALEGSQWCATHKARLFAMLEGKGT